MKKCPACNREYDHQVSVCLDDGTTLVAPSESAAPTFTPPAGSGFQVPPPPALVVPTAPTMSVGRTLLNIFIAPARAFSSFRDTTAFGPATARFLIAAGIIIAAVVIFNVVYMARFGQATIMRAALEATPRMRDAGPELKEQTLRMTENPAFRVVTLLTTFGGLVFFTLIAMPVGALIYWLGALAFKAPMNYLQALLV